jgi:hypothetical protein
LAGIDEGSLDKQIAALEAELDLPAPNQLRLRGVFAKFRKKISGAGRLPAPSIHRKVQEGARLGQLHQLLSPQQHQMVEAELQKKWQTIRRKLDLAAGKQLIDGAHERIEIALDNLAASQARPGNVADTVTALRQIAAGERELSSYSETSEVRFHIRRMMRKHGDMDPRRAARAAILFLKNVYSKEQIKDPRKRRGRVRDVQITGLITAIGDALQISNIEVTAYHQGKAGAYQGTVVRVLGVLCKHYPKTLGCYRLESLFELAKELKDQKSLPFQLVSESDEPRSPCA